MRTLAIDYGTRRVGLALSDQGGKFATPLAVLEVHTPAQAAEMVLKVVGEEGVDRLVIGLPLNMDGSTGAQAQETIRWAGELAEASGKRVVFVDERLSSFDAEQGLIARKRAGEKITRRGKKSRLDALAAAAFLQEFLDGKLPETPVIPPGQS